MEEKKETRRKIKKMKAWNAEEILKLIVEIATDGAEGLKGIRKNGKEQYLYGVKITYITILEFAQLWDKAKEIGLDYNIEERFPID